MGVVGVFLLSFIYKAFYATPIIIQVKPYYKKVIIHYNKKNIDDNNCFKNIELYLLNLVT